MVRLGIVLGVLALFAYGVFGAEGLLEQLRRHARYAELQERLTVERARNDSLRGELQALRNDDLAIERAIRTELDYRRPGEVVFVLGSPDPLDPGAGFDSPRASP